MAFLTLLSIAERMPDPSGFPTTQMWQFFILKVFDFVTHYGWRIVVFAVCLKLVLAPLDIYQRYVMRKNQRIKERIQPDLDKLEAQFGNNRPLLQQKIMQLNKREGFSYASTCILALVPMIIFITVWPGITSISQYMYMKQYLQFYDIYQVKEEQVIEEHGLVKDTDPSNTLGYKLSVTNSFTGTKDEIDQYISGLLKDAQEKAQFEVKEQYDNNLKMSFFWIKNLWAPDVPWKKPILEYDSFISTIGKKYTQNPELIGAKSDDELARIISSETYNKVTFMLRTSDDNKVNGWLILPIFSVGLSFLSQFIMSKQQKKSGMTPQGGQGASTMKMMLIMMPIMIGFFSLQYTSIFTLYLVTNSLLTLLLNLLSTQVLKLIDVYSERKTKFVNAGAKDEPQIMRYGRPDPNATRVDSNKNGKKKR